MVLRCVTSDRSGWGCVPKWLYLNKNQEGDVRCFTNKVNILYDNIKGLEMNQ